jgi:hypothetical protein
VLGGGNEKVRNSSCEINVVEHCNLSCRSCSHVSPAFRRTVLDPAALEHDLSLLAEHYNVGTVRLLGGEPLLHPDLPAIVEAVRRSGIGQKICVVTNGLLLPRMSRALWEAVDVVELSSYPGSELGPDDLDRCREEADATGTRLDVIRVQMFRESYSEVGTDDAGLIGQIYQTCIIAHVWRCHTVANGAFYKCPQSYFLPKLLGADLGMDGVTIDEPDLGRRLRAYLASPEPLAACRNCLGSAGRRFAHEQTPRAEFRTRQGQRTEDLIDPDYLGVTPWPPERERETISTS